MQATQNELLDILRNCAQTGFIQNIVLDGIDECNDSTELLSDLCKALKSTAVKIILFSRPHVKEPPGVSLNNRLAIGRSTSPDIEIFLRRKLQDLVQQNQLPSNVDINSLLDPLVTGADGMFLWARLMMIYLNSELSPSQRLREINNVKLPEGLDKMYDRVFGLLSQGSGPNQAIGKWVFMWITFSCRQLTANELIATLKVRSMDNHDNYVDFPDFDRTVMSTCASLVEKSKMHNTKSESVVECYRFIHLSVSEFLGSRLRKEAQWFLLSESDSHLTIARSLLQYLSLHGPIRSRNTASRELPSASEFEELYPFCEYAVSYWSGHLQRHRNSTFESSRDRIPAARNIRCSNVPLRVILQASQKERPRVSSAASERIFFEFASTLSLFISRKSSIMAYIEISYHIDAVERANFDELQDWFAWAMPAVPALPGGQGGSYAVFQDACEFVSYLKLLDKEWGSKLRKRPGLIWDEVTAFTPCRLLHQTKSTKVYSLISDAPRGQRTSSRYLCKVSEVSNDQKHVGVLSIWPSK